MGKRKKVLTLDFSAQEMTTTRTNRRRERTRIINILKLAGKPETRLIEDLPVEMRYYLRVLKGCGKLVLSVDCLLVYNGGLINIRWQVTLCDMIVICCPELN